MGLDDVEKTVMSVTWLGLGTSLLVLALALRAPRPMVSRGTAAFLLGAMCWAYHVGLLVGAQRPLTYLAGSVGLALGSGAAAALARSEWAGVPGLSAPLGRTVFVVAAWSALAVVLLALLGLGKP